MICEKCGAVIEDGHIMCPKCGALVEFKTNDNYGINWDIKSEPTGTVSRDKVSQEVVNEKVSSAKIKQTESEVDLTVESVARKEALSTDNKVKVIADLEQYEKRFSLKHIYILLLIIIVIVGGYNAIPYISEKFESAGVSESNKETYNYMDRPKESVLRFFSFDSAIYNNQGEIICGKASLDKEITTVLFNSDHTICRYIDFSSSTDGESGTLYSCAENTEPTKIAENVCEIYGIGDHGENNSYYRTVDGEIYSYNESTGATKLCYENVVTMALDSFGETAAFLCEEDGEYVVYYDDHSQITEVLRGQKLAPFAIPGRTNGNFIYLRSMDNGKIYKLFISNGELRDLGVYAYNKSDAVYNQLSGWLLVNQKGTVYCARPNRLQASLVTHCDEDTVYADVCVDGFKFTYIKGGKIYETEVSTEYGQYSIETETLREDYKFDDYFIDRSGDAYFLSGNTLFWSYDISYDPKEIVSNVKMLYTEKKTFNSYTAVVQTTDNEYYIFVDGIEFKLDKSPF